ncbi:MAG: excinuclease subunit [Bacteroidetes bacterium]|nr:excinuclease subunit [Bacteroidota bacterium]
MVFYIGVTNDLERRMREHKEGSGSIFTQRYNVNVLVYYEIHNDIRQAIKREKQLKAWKRDWKIELIRSMNADMIDLAKDWCEDAL